MIKVPSLTSRLETLRANRTITFYTHDRFKSPVNDQFKNILDAYIA